MTLKDNIIHVYSFENGFYGISRDDVWEVMKKISDNRMGFLPDERRKYIGNFGMIDIEKIYPMKDCRRRRVREKWTVKDKRRCGEARVKRK